MGGFIAENWEYFLLGFMILEKVVKLTPTKYDDIVLDIILKPVMYRISGKKNDSPSQ